MDSMHTAHSNMVVEGEETRHSKEVRSSASGSAGAKWRDDTRVHNGIFILLIFINGSAKWKPCPSALRQRTHFFSFTSLFEVDLEVQGCQASRPCFLRT